MHKTEDYLGRLTVLEFRGGKYAAKSPRRKRNLSCFGSAKPSKGTTVFVALSRLDRVRRSPPHLVTLSSSLRPPCHWATRHRGGLYCDGFRHADPPLGGFAGGAPRPPPAAKPSSGIPAYSARNANSCTPPSYKGRRSRWVRCHHFLRSLFRKPIRLECTPRRGSATRGARKFD